MIPFFFLAVIALLGAGQPPANTTDVDEHTTPTQASPLDPSKGAPPPVVPTPAPGERSLDDILSAVPPYEPPAPVVTVPEEAPRAGVVVTSPAGIDTPQPTYLYDRDSRPDGPPSDSDTLYETRVLGAFRAAQGNQGPLDGRWLVARPNGEVLYALQFADPGGGQIEGAWRDMHVTGKGATGFIESVDRGGTDTVVHFLPPATGKPAEVRVHPSRDGAWIGQATSAAGLVPVVMTRDKSVELAAQGAPIYVPPPAPPGRAGKHGKHGKASAHGKAASHGKSASKAKGSKAKGGAKPAKKKKH